MNSRRDQVQAHMFTMSRLTSAMLRGDPDAPESPQGRTNRSVVMGVVIAVLLGGGFFVYGLISPGSTTSWKSGRALVVDEQTGSSYLYLDGRLRPVRNYASALLLVGSSLTTTTVRTSSLSGTPEGRPVGIPGAPDHLPATSDLDTGAWQVCSTATTSSSGAASTATTLAVGQEPSGEQHLTGGQAVLAEAPHGGRYLLWRGSRLRLDSSGNAATALGYGSATPLHVSAAFLDALPAGPDLAAPDTPGLGEAGPALDGRGTRVGQVFEISVIGSAPQYYELRREGLTRLTATEADLLLGAPDVRRKAYAGATPAALPVGSDALLGHEAPGSGQLSGDGLPPAPPSLTTQPAGEGVCAVVTPGAAGPGVSIAFGDASGLGPATDPSSARAACLAVDRVVVRPGTGALVRVLGADGSAQGTVEYLVTDTGVKYRVASSTELSSLGYTGATAVGLPSTLLSMLPTGPDLSADDAGAGTAVTTAPPCGTAPGGTGTKAA